MVSADRRIFLFPNDPPVNSKVKPVNRVRGFFLGVRAAYIDNLQNFGTLNLLRIQRPSAYILGGELRLGPFTANDADRDNYSMDPAFNGSTTPGEPVNLLFADGSVRSYTHFDQSVMTTRYEGPGLANPEW
jgi:prepilin-type processing-associated H-X9-DG protein